MAKCLYNTYSDNIAAYCHNSDHPYAMTVTQMNCKNCLGKQCKHFEREESHPIWHQKAVQKQKRKQRKERLNAYVARVQGKV